jgi:UDP-N-acetylmuramoyl-L-alanyl-D-glutamate--2,6-diaminopimelate ligase
MQHTLRLSSLVAQGFVSEIRGDQNLAISGIKHDSRRVQPGDLFVALAGEHSDGMRYVRDAFERGAVAVLAERPLEAPLPVLITDNALLALSRIATRLYGDPSAYLEVVGVTGTNGKTTTCYLVEAMLERAGARPAVVGTVNFRGPQGVRPATHTTPMADDLMRTIRDAVDAGASHLVLEVSSHALAMHRADGVHFKVAAFTNLTQDHLDYHGDFAAYEKAKWRLFDSLSPKIKVINIDDAVGARFAQALSGEIVRCSRRADSQAQIRALDWTSDRGGIRARLATPLGELEIESPLVGDHNLENLLVSLGCGIALGIDRDYLVQAIREAKGAPGRLERIDHPHGVLALVDYAHTPDALGQVLLALRPHCTGTLTCVFGCGGDRDQGKRPQMGAIAVANADRVVVTDDNPRTEDGERIVAEVLAGIADRSRVRVQRDRGAAIAEAVAAGREGDVVLVAGKGHEDYQIVGHARLPYSDRATAARLTGDAPPAGAAR